MTRTTDASASRRAVMLGAAAVGLACPPDVMARATPNAATGSLPVAALRGIDPGDEDFTDLEPLARAIGGARVVQLGEPSHGAGAAFSAKARLVKFLHRRMGFDLLVWESGFYDVELTQAGLRAGEDPVAAARRGVFGLWSNAEEVRPLFAYAQQSREGRRPLDMAGFDLQVTATGSRQRFAADLAAFAAAPQDAGVRAAATAQVETAVKARDRLFATRFAEAADLQTLNGAAGALLASIRARRAVFEGAWGRHETEFMEHAIENMRIDALQRYEATRATSPAVARENRRDALNFENLRWLLERRYAGRKAVIWAHNAHVMNAHYAPDFQVARARARHGDMKPTGVFLRDWLGRDAYTIGITTFEGTDGLATGGATTSIPEAPPASLEARLHALSQPYLFVDLRGGMQRDPSMLRAVAWARFPKYDLSPAADLAHAYDGLLFIDRMTPATALRT